METLLQIVAGTVAGGVLSVLAAACVAYFALWRWMPHLGGFAVGAMLGTALLDLIPEALESGLPARNLGVVLMAGLLAFFLLERWARRRAGDPRISPAVPAVLLGDTLHNFTDGVLIAAAFLHDPALGVMTTVAVVAHEIPQEVGDFMVLVGGGLSRAQALAWNVASSLASIAGGVIGYFVLRESQVVVPYFLALGAASFLYVSIAGLIPAMHQGSSLRAAPLQMTLMLAGAGSVAGLAHTH